MAYGNNPPEKKTRRHRGSSSTVLIAALLPFQVSLLKLRYQSGERVESIAADYHVKVSALVVYAHTHGWHRR